MQYTVYKTIRAEIKAQTSLWGALLKVLPSSSRALEQVPYRYMDFYCKSIHKMVVIVIQRTCNRRGGLQAFGWPEDERKKRKQYGPKLHEVNRKKTPRISFLLLLWQAKKLLKFFVHLSFNFRAQHNLLCCLIGTFGSNEKNYGKKRSKKK